MLEDKELLHKAKEKTERDRIKDNKAKSCPSSNIEIKVEVHSNEEQVKDSDKLEKS